MKNHDSEIKIHHKYVYLIILGLAILTSTMMVIPRYFFWFSVAMVFCSLVFYIYRDRPINKRFFYWVIAFCLFFLISIFWALSAKLVLFVLLIRILPILIITFSVSMYINSLPDLYDILRVFYFVSIFILIYLLLFVDISSISERLSFDQLGGEWNPNTIGVQFGFAIYIGAVLFWKKKSFIKILYLVVTLLMLYFITITGSRKALIMLFIPLIYFVFFKKQIKFSVKLTLFLLGLGGVYALFSIPILYDIAGKRIMDLVTMLSGDVTAAGIDNSRIFLILYGWEWFQDRIWLGYGINNYRVLSDATQMFAGKNFYAHNNYIELLVGVGVMGTLVYYYGYYYIIRRAIKQKSQLTQWVIALILTILFIDVGQVTYYGMMPILFICIGFSAISLKLDQHKR